LTGASSPLREDRANAATARVIVLQRPESSVIQPIGGIYNGQLLATLYAPNIAFDAFDCLESELRASGLTVKTDHQSADPGIPLGPELAALAPVRIGIAIDRLRTDIADNIAQIESSFTITARSDGGAVGYNRVHVLRGTVAVDRAVDLACYVGEILARRLLRDSSFVQAIGGGP